MKYLLLVLLLSGHVFAQAPAPAKTEQSEANKEVTQAEGEKPAEEETPVLNISVFGTAFPQSPDINPPAAITKEQLDAEFNKLKIKFTTQAGEIDSWKRNPPAESVIEKYDSYIIKLNDIPLLSKNYRPILGLEKELACSQEVQIATLKSSKITKLDQLEGKNVAIEEIPVVMHFLSSLKVKNVQYLAVKNPKDAVNALKEGTVSAIIEKVRKRGPGITLSRSIGKYKNGKPSDYRVIGISNFKLPCDVLAAHSRINREDLSQRMLNYMKESPEISKSVFNQLGSFYKVYPISSADWNRMKGLMSTEIMDKYKKGDLKLNIKPLTKK